MPVTAKSPLRAAIRRLTPVPLDGAAFLVNLFIATVGGMLLGSIFLLLVLGRFAEGAGTLVSILAVGIFCIPALAIGYVALWKFDQQSAMWTWAVGTLIWIALVSIDLSTFNGRYCGLNRWQHIWFDYIYPDPNVSCD